MDKKTLFAGMVLSTNLGTLVPADLALAFGQAPLTPIEVIDDGGDENFAATHFGVFVSDIYTAETLGMKREVVLAVEVIAKSLDKTKECNSRGFDHTVLFQLRDPKTLEILKQGDMYFTHIEPQDLPDLGLPFGFYPLAWTFTTCSASHDAALDYTDATKGILRLTDSAFATDRFKDMIQTKFPKVLTFRKAK